MTSIVLWQETRTFKRGAVVGALVLTYFGAAWAFVALANHAAAPEWLFGVFAIPVIALTAASGRRIGAIARTPRAIVSASAALESTAQGRRIGRAFAAVLGIEVAAIAVAGSTLAAAGRPLLVPVAIVAIVGAHFLPLARVFRIPTYGYAGAVLLALAAASFVIGHELTRDFWLGLATALVLWTSAGAVLSLHT